MSEYYFGISYIMVKENVVADSLSRRPRVFSLVPLKVNLRIMCWGNFLYIDGI
jgi:hypothetical protein